MNKNKQGFTLIELLVVIAIIGILSTLSILALNSARARARDAKRISDVKQIQTALEMYYNDNNDYPSSTAIVPGASIGTGTNVYLKSIPTPPSPADGGTVCAIDATKGYTYTYTGVAGNSSYTINYCLGASINGIPASSVQTAGPNGIK